MIDPMKQNIFGILFNLLSVNEKIENLIECFNSKTKQLDEIQKNKVIQ